jgi:cation diffusion facilitator CzcD-associated flavoprotein CzcO/acetyl esterase/lipase
MNAVERARRAFGRRFTNLTLGRWLRAEVPYAKQRRRVAVVGRLGIVPRGTQVEHVELGGVRTEKVALGTPDPRRAILLIHSGGYTVSDARGHRPLAALLSKAAAATVFTIDYRLAPEHPYPAAFDDALAAYAALREQGYEPGSLALAGDSAGGGLTLGTAQRLRDAGEELPAALLIMCPYLDLSHSGESVTTNAGRDYLNVEWGEANREALAPGRDGKDPEISPLFGDLAGLPPIHLQSAGDDILLSDADRLEERVLAAGGTIEHRREPDVWHDFQAMPDLCGAARNAIRDGGEALRRAWAGQPDPPVSPAADGGGVSVAIVGAGFGGVAMALELQRAGIHDFTIFDRGEGFGGTWRANTYPGAACDIPARLYSLAREPKFDWSQRYAPQAEILEYLEEVADRNGLREHLRSGTEITRSEFDSAAGVWRLTTATGEVHEAGLLVTACGQLSRPAIPEIPGIERFEGPAFHSAEWDHAAELDGKDVAVIGTGASAIQFAPEIAPRAGSLRVFQRSPHYMIPRMQVDYGRLGSAMQRIAPWRLATRFGLFAPIEFLGTGFGRTQAPLIPLKAMAAANRRKLPEGPLRDAMTPADTIGCKRILISSDWYEMFNRPNVDLVTERIDRITPGGVMTVGGTEHPADTIIWGTGFRTTEFLAPMEVIGPGGRELNEAWAGGASAYLGMTLAGFPNMAMMYGPYSNQGSGSIIRMLESQANYIAQLAKRLEANPGVAIEPRPEVCETFDAEMQAKLGNAVWSTGCDNWYVDASGRNSNNWPGTTSSYRRRVGRLEPADYVA